MEILMEVVWFGKYLGTVMCQNQFLSSCLNQMSYGRVMTDVEKMRIEEACIDAMDRYRPLDGQHLMSHNAMRMIRRISKTDIRENGWEELDFDGRFIYRANRLTYETMKYDIQEGEYDEMTMEEFEEMKQKYREQKRIEQEQLHEGLRKVREEELREQAEQDPDVKFIGQRKIEPKAFEHVSIFGPQKEHGPYQKDGYSEYIDVNDQEVWEIINLVDEDEEEEEDDSIVMDEIIEALYC